MSDTLHEEPQKDGFTHETPIRAFTTFSVDGLYAIGKGFRPSLQHLMPYLNAMERKEGWRLVQILEAFSQTPSFVFRRELPPVMTINADMLHNAMAADPSVFEALRDRVRYPLADPIMPELREMDNRSDEQKAQDDADEIRNGSYRLSGIEAMREIDNARRKVGVAPELGMPYTPSDPVTYEQFSDPTKPSGIGWREVDPAAEFKKAVDQYVQGGKKIKVDGVPIEETVPQKVARIRREQQCEAYHHGTVDGEPIQPPADDPVNLKHYGGTACAEIGELLTANSYQVLKYNWRLGEKDDEKVELGKAIWYLRREIALAETIMIPARMLPEHGWFDERLRHATPHAQAVARILISWNRYRNIHSLRGLGKTLKRMLRELETAAALDMDRGLEP